MKNPDLAARVAEAAVKAVDVPVTVKMRIGWDSDSINVVDFAKRIDLQVWRLLQYMAVLRSKCTVGMLIGLILRL